MWNFTVANNDIRCLASSAEWEGWLRGLDLNQRPLGYEPNSACKQNQLKTANPKKKHVFNLPGFGLSSSLSEPVHGQNTDSERAANLPFPISKSKNSGTDLWAANPTRASMQLENWNLRSAVREMSVCQGAA